MGNEMPVKFYSAIQETSIDWLWYPYIPYGKLTLLQGDPGDGKSTFMINLAACLTTGSSLPDGSLIDGIQTVIYQCAEDNSADTIKPRLMAAGADCSKIAFIDDPDGELTLSDSRLEQAIRNLSARLLILDPLQSFIPQDVDMQSAAKMRAVMRKLAKLAERYQCAIVMIGHMNKNEGGKKLYRGLGSIDIAAIARSVLLITRNTTDPELRYMYPLKSSLAPEGDAIAFRLDRENGFQWIGKCKKYDSEDQERHPAGKLAVTKVVLESLLRDVDLPSAEIMKILLEKGISERTVRSASKELGIDAYRADGKWMWHLQKQTRG